jgi:hypothetical protein
MYINIRKHHCSIEEADSLEVIQALRKEKCMWGRYGILSGESLKPLTAFIIANHFFFLKKKNKNIYIYIYI